MGRVRERRRGEGRRRGATTRGDDEGRATYSDEREWGGGCDVEGERWTRGGYKYGGGEVARMRRVVVESKGCVTQPADDNSNGSDDDDDVGDGGGSGGGGDV